MVMMIRAEKTNWLLQGLIALSVGVHLVFLMSMADRFQIRRPVAIELDLRTIATPVQREIPHPEQAPGAAASSDTLKNLPAPEKDPVPLRFSAPPDIDHLMPSRLTEPMGPVQIPAVKAVDIAAWDGEIETAAPFLADTADAEASPPPTEDYGARLKEIIPKIYAEAERLYARKARRRQIQGRTVVRVTVDVNGGLAAAAVAESANSPILDQIAMKAVSGASPFPKPSGGPVTIDIPIVFKLM